MAFEQSGIRNQPPGYVDPSTYGYRSDKAGWAKDWQSSIPTAYQARQNALANVYAKGLGFRGAPDFQKQLGNYGNMNMYANRAKTGTGYGYSPEAKTWGPTSPGTPLPASYANRYASPQFNNMMSNYQQNPQQITNLLAMLQQYMRGSSYAR